MAEDEPTIEEVETEEGSAAHDAGVEPGESAAPDPEMMKQLMASMGGGEGGAGGMDVSTCPPKPRRPARASPCARARARLPVMNATFGITDGA